MSESFMTIEGDRASVIAPTEHEKAHRAIEAACHSLDTLRAWWARYSDYERLVQLERVQASLHRAMMQIQKAP